MATVAFPEIAQANNAITTLNGAINDSTTTVVLATGGATALGLSGSTTDAYITVIDSTTWRKNPLTTPETLEIMQVTAVSGDTLTVTRGVDGTSGTAFGDGSIVELRINAAMIQRIYDALTDGTDDLNIAALIASGDIDPATERGSDLGSATKPFNDIHGELLNLFPSNAGSQPTRYISLVGNVSGSTIDNYLDIKVPDGTPTQQTVVRYRATKRADYSGQLQTVGWQGSTVKTHVGDGTTTVDWGADGNVQSFTFGAMNETFTFTAPSNSNPGICALTLTQDSGGSRTATWPASVKWVSGTAPTLTTAANAVDLVVFVYTGSSYLGFSFLNYS